MNRAAGPDFGKAPCRGRLSVAPGRSDLLATPDFCARMAEPVWRGTPVPSRMRAHARNAAFTGPTAYSAARVEWEPLTGCHGHNG